MVDFYQQGARKANSWLFKMCCNSIVSVNNMSRRVQHAAYSHTMTDVYTARDIMRTMTDLYNFSPQHNKILHA